MNNNQSQLLETVLAKMDNKQSTEVDVTKNYSYKDCEAVRYKMWDQFKIEIHEENRKLKLSVWRK